MDILTFQMLKNNKKNNEKKSDKDPFILILLNLKESAEKFDNQKSYMSYLIKNIDQYSNDSRRLKFKTKIVNKLK